MTVQIAFIGSGGIAQWQHFDNLEELDDADIVGICDVDEEAARTAANRFDAAVFTDHETLYEELEFDAVFVCLPPFAHENQELLAAERGINLFVEKPLGLTIETAQEIESAIEDSNIISQVGYNWRYAPAVDRAREILADRTIEYLDGRFWGGVPGGEDHWWRREDRSGGQVVEQATHIFDAIRFLAGDVEKLYADGTNRVSDLVDFPDATSTTMTHESGAVSHVSTSCVAETADSRIEVIAEGATLTIRQNELTGTVDGEEIYEEFDRNPYAAEVEDFLEAVESDDGAALRAPYSDARKTFELTLAVTDSIESNESVRLE